MHVRSLAALASLAAVLGLAQHATAAGDDPVVTVAPACPEWKLPTAPGQPTIPPEITIRYNTKSSAARLKSSQALNLVLAEATLARFDSRTIPMARSEDGTWQAEFTPKKYSVAGYSIFFFRDDNGRVDNNGSLYWDILCCEHSQVSVFGIEIQASTYEGRLLAPGIQRPPDLARAIEILKTDLQARPSAATHYPALWRLELEQGHETPATYEQLGREVDAFLSAHGKEMLQLEQAAGFVAAFQRKLPPSVIERFRATLSAFPETGDLIQINSVTKEIIHVPRNAHFVAVAQQEVTRHLAEFDYWSIDSNEKDERKKAAAYLEFAAKYPGSLRTSSAYWYAFQCEKQLNDISAAEAIFEKWVAVDPRAVQPLLDMAQFYIEQKTKPARALELLDAVQKIYLESELPSSHQHYARRPGQLDSLRGQAHLLLNDLPAARADFEAASNAAPEDPRISYTLGKLCEQMGDNTAALNAYLAAASAPYQEDAAPGEAYERLFVAQRLGNHQDASKAIASRVAERTRRVAADYMPVAINRPAPAFAFTDLTGKRFDNQAAKGKPAVLTFWGIWCAPCVAELPALEEFQRQHPSVNILAVEIGNQPNEVKTFLATHNLNSLHVAARTDWPQEFGGGASPMSVVIDRFGHIQFEHVGQLADVEAILGKDLDALPPSIP